MFSVEIALNLIWLSQMHERGLEPPQISLYGPKPYAATNYATRAIGLLGVEPSSHRYKQWALTDRRQSRLSTLLLYHKLPGVVRRRGLWFKIIRNYIAFGNNK